MDELGLTYKEHKGLVDSDFIVQTFTPAQEAAAKVLREDVKAFVRKLARIEREEERQEQNKKIARKNRVRRLTFRKPLAYV